MYLNKKKHLKIQKIQKKAILEEEALQQETLDTNKEASSPLVEKCEWLFIEDYTVEYKFGFPNKNMHLMMVKK